MCKVTVKAKLGAVGLVILSGAIIHLGLQFKRQMEDDVRISAYRQMESALNGADAGLWVWQMGEDRIYWDKHLLAMFGRGDDWVPTYEGWLAMVHPDDRDMADEICSQAIAREESYQVGYRIIRGDGEEVAIIEFGTVEGRVMSGICFWKRPKE